MRRRDLPPELLDAFLRPTAPEDGVSTPDEFIHHRPAQAARHPGDQHNPLSHKLGPICLTGDVGGKHYQASVRQPAVRRRG